MMHWPFPAEKSAASDGAAVTMPAVIRSTWALSGILFGLALVVLMASYWSTVVSIVAIWWRSDTFAHGFFIVPISLYMVWTRRHALARLTPEPSLWGLPSLAFIGIVWLLGYAGNVVLVQQLSFTMMIPLLVVTLLGTRIARAIAFPLAYLIFAVPFGEFLIPPLMDWTAWFSVRALQVTGIPVYAEGRFITVPTGMWEVAEVCSGLRFLIASLAVGCLYAYLTYRSTWRRIAFIVLAAIVPIIGNGIRAYGIILLGHFSDMRLAAGVDHIIYGWLFFGVVILVLFWIGSYWREQPEDFGRTREPARHDTPEAAPGASRQDWKGLAAGVAALVLVAVGPAGAAWIDRDPDDGEFFAAQLPAGNRGWIGPNEADEPWEPRFPALGQRAYQMYAGQNRRIFAYVIHYARQRQGQEIISNRNRADDGDYWIRTAESRRSITLPDGKTLEVHETEMRSVLSKRLVWYWYDIAGHTTANPLLGKLWESWARVTGDGNGATLVMLAAAYDQNPEGARDQLRMFIADMPSFTRSGALVRATP